MKNIPQNANELYQALTSSDELCGEITLINENSIVWNVHKNLTLDIGINLQETYINVNNGLFHWHAANEDVYEDLCAICKKDHILVIKKTIFSTSIFYSGLTSEYKYHKNVKWRWGKLYYLG